MNWPWAHGLSTYQATIFWRVNRVQIPSGISYYVIVQLNYRLHWCMSTTQSCGSWTIPRASIAAESESVAKGNVINC